MGVSPRYSTIESCVNWLLQKEAFPDVRAVTEHFLKGQSNKIKPALTKLKKRLSMQDDAIINKHTIESATKVQSAGRMHIHKHKFRQKKKSSIKIQTAIRGKLARRNATTLSKMAPVLARLHAAIIEHHFLYGTAITNDLFKIPLQ